MDHFAGRPVSMRALPLFRLKNLFCEPVKTFGTMGQNEGGFASPARLYGNK
jgi:hypothetical protein